MKYRVVWSAKAEVYLSEDDEYVTVERSRYEPFYIKTDKAENVFDLVDLAQKEMGKQTFGHFELFERQLETITDETGQVIYIR